MATTQDMGSAHGTFARRKLLSFMGLRVTSKEEAVGLDIAAHGEEGYRIVPSEQMPELDVPEPGEGVTVASGGQ